MLVSEILRIKGDALFTAAPRDSVLRAVEVMAEHDIGSLVVMDHGRMAGMLTFPRSCSRWRSAAGPSAISPSMPSTSVSRSSPRPAST